MAYEYVSFDGVSLPIYNPNTDLSAPEVADPLLETIGGVFDVEGSNVRYPKRSTIISDGLYIGEKQYLIDHLGNYIVDHLGNYIVTGSDANNLRAQLDTLYAKLGKRGNLYRSRLDDNVLQFKRARLLSINHQRVLEDRLFKSRVVSKFVSDQPFWHSTTLTSVTGTIAAHGLNFVPLYLFANMAGNATVYDAVITISAIGAVNSVTVVGGDIDFTWTGTLGEGNDLIIDCGAQTIRNNGLDAYTGFSLASDHVVDGWLPLHNGENVLIFTIDNFADVTIEYYDQWI